MISGVLIWLMGFIMEFNRWSLAHFISQPKHLVAMYGDLISHSTVFSHKKGDYPGDIPHWRCPFVIKHWQWKIASSMIFPKPIK